MARLMPTRRVLALFALPEEAKPFVRGYRDNKITGEIYGRRDITYAISGIGVKNAAKSLEPRFDTDLPIGCLIVCGFCGGLLETAEPGSLILADKVTTEKETFLPDVTLFAAAETLHLPDVKVQNGTLVTVDKVVTTAAEKRGLAARTGAIAVDMETAGAVRVAQERGIPWLAVRAITDGLNDELPLDFNALANPDGSINRGRIIRATLAHPHKIPALIRLGQRSSLAANNLAAFLVAFLQTLPENET